MPAMEIFITGIGILIVVAIVLYFWQEKKRVEAIKAFSYQNGYLYEPELGLDIRPTLDSLGLLNTGGGRTFKNALSRDTSSGKIWIFDYQYSTGSGRSRTTYQQTVSHQI